MRGHVSRLLEASGHTAASPSTLMRSQRGHGSRRPLNQRAVVIGCHKIPVGEARTGTEPGHLGTTDPPSSANATAASSAPGFGCDSRGGCLVRTFQQCSRRDDAGGDARNCAGSAGCTSARRCSARSTRRRGCCRTSRCPGCREVTWQDVTPACACGAAANGCGPGAALRS